MESGVFFFDAQAQVWQFASPEHYPWVYAYAPVGTWLRYEPGGAPTERSYYHPGNRAYIDAHELRNPAALAGMIRLEGLADGPGIDPLEGFYLGRHEVTYGQWSEVRAWAVEHGYDLAGVGDGCGPLHPVHSVNWHDAVKWCNARSEKEGLEPVYTVDGEVYRSGQARPSRESGHNGYRLPTRHEWMFAAAEGRLFPGAFLNSLSLDDVREIAWIRENSAGSPCPQDGKHGSWPVGSKPANAFGFHDMLGNVWEWTWDATAATGGGLELRGSSWKSSPFAMINFEYIRTKPQPVTQNPYLSNDYGFRVARDIEP